MNQRDNPNKYQPMKTFASFLAESFTVGQFAHAAPAIRAQRMDRLVELLNQYATGDVPNPVFGDIKSLANDLVDKATSSYDANPTLHERIVNMTPNGFTQFDSHQYSLMYTNQVAGKLKLAEKNRKSTTVAVEKEYLDWMLPILRELKPLADFVDGMKARVVKRQPKPKEDEYQKYVAPLASRASSKLVIEALQDITAKIFKQFETEVAKWMTTEAERMAAMSADDQQKMRQNSMWSLRIWEWASESNTVKAKREKGRVLKAGYRKEIEAEATSQAEYIQQQFVIKNAKKLGSILDAKKAGLTGKPEVLKAHVFPGRGAFEGDMRLTFADGSKFEVRNQVVFKSNHYGTFFVQYPTTFHNVTMPDGSAMKTPSEERMNTVFATA